MQFNQKALDAKMSHLDEIKKYPKVLKDVIERNIKSDFELIENKRIWTGGGSTSYIIKTNTNKFFLKIKHKEVTVESKLEEEEDFIDEPCISHEKRMLELANRAGVNVPKIIFFDEEKNFQFLATEYIESSFDETLMQMTLEETIRLWQDLEKSVLLLFNAGLIHSDIHEYNIRFKGKIVFLIDLEETRELRQNCTFKESLDYLGKNGESSLGDFPLAEQQDYTVKVNSLARMRQVIKKYLIPKMTEYIKECNYDSKNGICTALDHGCSEDTYQSIQNKWMNIKGQREQNDTRPILICKLFKYLNVFDNYTFVDIGSNNGLFCRKVSNTVQGKIRIIGLEGFRKFNILANSLSFLEDCNNIEYYDFLCGENELKTIHISNRCFISICSVWHHIQKKEIFLNQLKELDLRYVFLEMPVQKECYDNHSWEEEIHLIKQNLGFADEMLLGYSLDYNRPLVLLSKEIISAKVRHKILKESKRILTPNLINKIMSYIKS